MNRIGIIDFSNLNETPKKELIFFDKLIIPNLFENIKNAYDQNLKPKSLLADLEYLISSNLISEPNFIEDQHKHFYNELSNSIFNPRNEYPEWLNSTLKEMISKMTIDYSTWKLACIHQFETEQGLHFFTSLYHANAHDQLERTRKNKNYYNLNFLMHYLENVNNESVIPIIQSSNILYSEKNEKSGDIMKIILHQIPSPDKNTSLEEIIDFKKDNEAKHKLNALRIWMNEVATSSKDTSLLDEKIKHLVNDYDKYMKIQRIKFNVGIFEFLFITTAETIENLAKLKLGSLAKSFYKLKYNKLSLLEKEMKAPGRELAYISHSNEKFKNKNK